MAGRAKPTPPTAKLIIHIDGREFYRATLPDIVPAINGHTYTIRNESARPLIVEQSPHEIIVLPSGAIREL